MASAPIFRLSDIPRYQRILFLVFLVAIALMAADLARLRHLEQTRLTATLKDAQLTPVANVPLVAVHLLVANDASNSLQPVERNLVLPKSPNAAARAILVALFAESAKPHSHHPLPAEAAVDDIFLLPLDAAASLPQSPSAPELAVINLNAAFARQSEATPATETLTLHSILATLHANFSQIQAARFLIDGRQSDTLAGAADLRRTYSTTAPYAPLPVAKAAKVSPHP
jgi:hypothetical protein